MNEQYVATFFFLRLPEATFVLQLVSPNTPVTPYLIKKVRCCNYAIQQIFTTLPDSYTTSSSLSVSVFLNVRLLKAMNCNQLIINIPSIKYNLMTSLLSSLKFAHLEKQPYYYFVCHFTQCLMNSFV